MITFITTLLSKINWTAVLSILGGIAVAIFGLFKVKQGETLEAQAKEQVAKKTVEVSQGNLAASQAATEALVAANQAAQEVKAIPAEDLDKVGAEMGIMREDK